MKTTERGRRGEQLARSFLEERGYQILEQNYHSPWGEIDLIASRGEFLVFAEVKTRRRDSLGTPAMAVSRSKQNKIILTAEQYLLDHPQELQPRFDIIEVVTDRSGGPAALEIRQIEGAFDCNGTDPFY